MSPRRAMIFAAGRGERLRPLTLTTPKPLLRVGGKRLVEWHLEKLARSGHDEVVINVSHLAEQFEPALGDGRRWNLRIHYVHEGAQPLETGGGMLNALPLLGDEPFTLVNGDIWTDFDFEDLPDKPSGDAHLVLVDNPAHVPDGNFHLAANGRVDDQASPRLTYAGIGRYRASLFKDWRLSYPGHAGAQARPPCFPLAPLLCTAMADGRVSGQHHGGRWVDIGTLERLEALNAELGS